MESVYGNNSSKFPKIKGISGDLASINAQMDNHQFIAPGHYYHSPESPSLDSFADCTNLDSQLIKYLRSGSLADAFKTPVVDVPKYRPMIGHRSNSNSSSSCGFGSSGSPLRAIENLETPPSRSPPVFNTPMKVEEDVLVIDGILVGAVSGARLRSSSSSDSGGSSSSGSKSFYKTEICRSWEDSGRCRYGSKCQFAHGKEELRPTRIPHKIKSEAQMCKSYPSGSCKYGSKCRFVHHQVTTPASPTEAAVASATTFASTDWCPLDDGIEIALPPSASSTDKAPSREEVNDYMHGALHGPIRRKRLSVFTEFCPE